jgi:hypothetical protein
VIDGHCLSKSPSAFSQTFSSQGNSAACSLEWALWYPSDIQMKSTSCDSGGPRLRGEKTRNRAPFPAV